MSRKITLHIKKPAKDLLELMRTLKSEPEKYICARQAVAWVDNACFVWEGNDGWNAHLVQFLKDDDIHLLVFDFLARRHICTLIAMQDAKQPLVFADVHDSSTGVDVRHARLQELVRTRQSEEQISTSLPTWRAEIVRHKFRLSRTFAGITGSEDLTVRLPRTVRKNHLRKTSVLKLLAFFMGTHARLGAESMLMGLKGDSLDMIVDYFVQGSLADLTTAEEVHDALVELNEMEPDCESFDVDACAHAHAQSENTHSHTAVRYLEWMVRDRAVEAVHEALDMLRMAARGAGEGGVLLRVGGFRMLTAFCPYNKCELSIVLEYDGNENKQLAGMLGMRLGCIVTRACMLSENVHDFSRTCFENTHTHTL